MREEKPKLSAKDRLCLIQTINALPPTQFDELVFALNPPKGVVASNSAAQGTRSKDLLDWLEGSSGPGLASADEVLQILIPTETKTAPQPVAFVISGKISSSTASELQAFVELLRKKTGDNSIDIAFFQEGSIKVILNGSAEGLAKLQEIFESGELEQLDIPSVEAVSPVDSSTQDARKARLIQALRLRGQLLVTLKVTSLVNDLDHALDLARDLARNLARDRDLDRDLVSNLALDITHVIDRASASASDLIRASNSVTVLSFASARDLAHDLHFDLARDFDLDHSLLIRARTLVNDLSLARSRARAHVYVTTRALTLDLSNADLSGANFRYTNLTGVNLTESDLTYADVTGTIFGDNPGLTEADKRDLQSRGAIFLDPPSSDVPALVLR